MTWILPSSIRTKMWLRLGWSETGGRLQKSRSVGGINDAPSSIRCRVLEYSSDFVDWLREVMKMAPLGPFPTELANSQRSSTVVGLSGVMCMLGEI